LTRNRARSALLFSKRRLLWVFLNLLLREKDSLSRIYSFSSSFHLTFLGTITYKSWVFIIKRKRDWELETLLVFFCIVLKERIRVNICLSRSKGRKKMWTFHYHVTLVSSCCKMFSSSSLFLMFFVCLLKLTPHCAKWNCQRFSRRRARYLIKSFFSLTFLLLQFSFTCLTFFFWVCARSVLPGRLAVAVSWRWEDDCSCCLGLN
jgi:hypothetical protein